MKINWVNNNSESYRAVLNMRYILCNIRLTLDYIQDEDCWILKAHSKEQPDFYVEETIYHNDAKKDAELIIKREIIAHLETLKERVDYLLKYLDTQT